MKITSWKAVVAAVAACASASLAISGTAAATTARSCNSIAAGVKRAELAYTHQFSSGSPAFPGGAIGVVMPGSACTYTFGAADQASGRRVTPTTQFEINSLTKLFTATLLARAVAQGRMSLSSPVQDYLPSGVRAPVDPSCPESAITIADLATEQSGLPYQPADYASSRADYSLKRLYRDLEKSRLARCPGSRYGASDFGYGLLGDLIARASDVPLGRSALTQGAAYQSLLRNAITRPLGMTRTKLEPLKPDPYLATAYSAEDSAQAPLTDDIGALAGAEGLVSSIGNMERFVKAALGRGPASQAAWLAATEEPLASGAQAGYRSGLGWQIGSASWLPSSFLVAGGASAGMSSYMMLVPSSHVGVVILSNQALHEPSHPAQLIVHALTPHSKAPPVS